MRWLVTACLAAGIAALALGRFAQTAGDPTTVTLGGVLYSITSHQVGEVIEIDLVDGNRVAFTTRASLDTLCDPPTLAVFDVDGDGDPDLYLDDCSGKSYVTSRDGELVDIRLGDEPPHTVWAMQVLSGGWGLLGVGAVLAIAGLVGIAMVGASESHLHRNVGGGTG